jgi:hypothetical protein
MAMSNLSSTQFANAPAAYAPIHASDLSTPDARRSRPVSHDEFQEIAARGEKKYSRLAQASKPVEGSRFDQNFAAISERAHQATREPWGGMTVDAHSGRTLPQGADKYALTVRPPGHPGITVPAGADAATFHGAMHQARAEYGDVLARKGHHLGVFHDADKGTVDIDPVVVVKKQQDAEDIGAYTHATGGAYHFKSGDGYWPPHVRG